MGRPIYVERLIAAPMETLWNATQKPDIHERWDIRFTEIRYLPRTRETEPQRFLYATRIGFGLRIEGEGESVGQSDRNGDRTSALRFWSDDRKSLIRTGSGYWRYVPTDAGVRFITQYDYETRFGVTGRASQPRTAPRVAVGMNGCRPTTPRTARSPAARCHSATAQSTRATSIGRGTLAFIWLFHGIVPKLLAPAGEIDLVTRTGIPSPLAPSLVLAAAAFEIALGVGILVLRDVRPLLALSTVLAIGLAVVTSARMPDLVVAPFQPITLGAAMVGLALVAAAADRDLPRARRCLRKPRTK